MTLTDLLPPATQARFLGWVVQPPGASFDEQQQQLRWQGTVRTDEPVTLRYRLGIEGDFPPGEILRNRASLQWSGGGMDLPPVDIPVFLTDNDKKLFVTIATDKASYLNHQTVYITTKVINQTGMPVKAAVSVKISTPNGTAITQTCNTARTGACTVS